MVGAEEPSDWYRNSGVNIRGKCLGHEGRQGCSRNRGNRSESRGLAGQLALTGLIVVKQGSSSSASMKSDE